MGPRLFGLELKGLVLGEIDFQQIEVEIWVPGSLISWVSYNLFMVGWLVFPYLWLVHLGSPHPEDARCGEKFFRGFGGSSCLAPNRSPNMIQYTPKN